MSLKEFLEVYDRYGFDEQAALEGYTKYKEAYLEEQYDDFFSRFKHQQWFQEFFSPSKYRGRMEEKRKTIVRNLGLWNDTMLSLKVTLKETRAESSKCMAVAAEDTLAEADDPSSEQPPLIADAATLAAYSASFCTFRPFLFIRSIHPSITREMLLKECQKLSDFDSIYLSMPSSLRRWHRTAWVIFTKPADSNDDFDEWIDEKWKCLDGLVINQFELHANLFKREADFFRTAMAAFSAPQRMKMDLHRAMQLISLFSQFYELELPHFYEEDPTFSEELLDMAILYLRSIFCFCYYCSTEYENIFEMKKECGVLHLRKANIQLEGDASLNVLEEFDERVEFLMRTRSRLFKSHETAREAGVDSELDASLSRSYVVPQETGDSSEMVKSRCGLCTKLFKGPEFVLKHVKLKHPEDVSILAQNLQMRRIFDENKEIFKNFILSEKMCTSNVSGSLTASNRANMNSASSNQRKLDPDRYYGSGYSRLYSNHFMPVQSRAVATNSASYSHRSTPYTRIDQRPEVGAKINREIKNYHDLDAPASAPAAPATPTLDYGSFEYD